jgi:hypothetical protein
MTSIRFQGAQILGSIPLREGDKKKQDQLQLLKQGIDTEIARLTEAGVPAAGFTVCDAYRGFSYKGLATGAEGQQLGALQTMKRSYEESINFDGMSQGERESRLAIAAAVGNAIDALSAFLFNHVAGQAKK